MGGLCALAVLAAGLAFAQAPDRKTVQVMGDLYLAADGTVDRATVDEQTPAQLKPIVEAAVKHWRFEPVLRDGVPTPVRTAMTLDLEGVPVEGGYKLRVTRLAFAQARARNARIVLPQLNTRMDVLVALRLDAEGNVADALVVSIANTRGKQIDPVRRNMIGDEIRKAVRKSKFRPAELAYGEEADDTYFLPIHYRIAGSGGADDADDHPFREMKRIPWLPADDQPKMPDVATLASGSAFAMRDEPVTLQSDVVGKML